MTLYDWHSSFLCDDDPPIATLPPYSAIAIKRGNCTFSEKAYKAASVKADAVIILSESGLVIYYILNKKS